MRFRLLALVTLFIHSILLPAQEIQDHMADAILKERGEVCFTIYNVSKSELQQLSKLISVDNIKGNTVFAYANRVEFSRFLQTGMEYSIEKAPGIVGNVRMSEHFNPSSTDVWDSYPTYQAYESLMNQFTSSYPNLCKLVQIGTLNSGRKLLAVKISNFPDSIMNKPRFLYTSSIHGDEITGYVNMLRLIDYLLSNYGTNTKVTNLVDNVEIFINPLANPDGTYHSGNNSVNGATRYNANGIDLNRNYPDPKGGPHPDQNPWQPETIFFMDFASQYGFNMSANFHGGAEVINYPWDTYTQFHADDAWWIHVSRSWADTVHLYSPASYLNDLNNGITNGNAWYEIEGGRQDYTTFFHKGREFTMEISNTKLVPAATLPNYWNYNYRSFLNYIEESLYGVRGIVTDSLTGAPLKAKVFISGHDIDSSFVYSRLPIGDYYRYLPAGNFDITYSSPGYYPKTLTSVNSVYSTTNVQDVQLVPLSTGLGERTDKDALIVYPNPTQGFVFIGTYHTTGQNCEIRVTNASGALVFSEKIKGDRLLNHYPLDLSSLHDGVYTLSVMDQGHVLKSKIIIY